MLAPTALLRSSRRNQGVSNGTYLTPSLSPPPPSQFGLSTIPLFSHGLYSPVVAEVVESRVISQLVVGKKASKLNV